MSLPLDLDGTAVLQRTFQGQIALLMGSVLVFGVLAGVMVLTRKLDWYGVGRLPLASPASKL